MKIDFFIAGFQKCATTTLKDMLYANSSVNMHDIEEMTHFTQKDSKPFEEAVYRQYYSSDNGELTGAKNVSLAIDENAIKSLHSNNANCKIILVLRNPVARAYSAYWYARRMGWEIETDFTKALAKSAEEYKTPLERRNCQYLETGYYAQHINNIYKWFPESQVKIIVLEKFPFSQIGMYTTVCEFLNIPADIGTAEISTERSNSSSMSKSPRLSRFITRPSLLSAVIKSVSPDSLIKRVKSFKEYIIKKNEYKFSPPKMDERARKKLVDYYNEPNSELTKILQHDRQIWQK